MPGRGKPPLQYRRGACHRQERSPTPTASIQEPKHRAAPRRRVLPTLRHADGSAAAARAVSHHLHHRLPPHAQFGIDQCPHAYAASSSAWKLTMHVFHTAGVPPSNGSTLRGTSAPIGTARRAENRIVQKSGPSQYRRVDYRRAAAGTHRECEEYAVSAVVAGLLPEAPVTC